MLLEAIIQESTREDYCSCFLIKTPPEQMELEARQLAAILKNDQVDVVLLVPV